MPESYFHLKEKEQRDILITAADRAGKNPIILEKDIWLVWTLNQLFSIPDRLPMAFKGGTSLSKIYQLIDRFSEDVDITIDYRSFNLKVDPLREPVSKSQIKKISDELKELVSSYIQNKIIPALNKSKNLISSTKIVNIDFDGEEKVYINYPSVLNVSDNRYIKNRILIEFGGRNVVEPNEEQSIKSDISSIVPALIFPEATVLALAPERTFWEKATLIHVVCNRNPDSLGRGHQFRHWYDLVKLYRSPIGKKAIANQQLLHEVVRLKSIFFNAPYAHYEDCFQKKLKLLPTGQLFEMIHYDFQEMIDEGMFYSSDVIFDVIMSDVEEIQNLLNQ